MQRQEIWQACVRCVHNREQCVIYAGQDSCSQCVKNGRICMTDVPQPETLLYRTRRRAGCERCDHRHRNLRCRYVQGKPGCDHCQKAGVKCIALQKGNEDEDRELVAWIGVQSSACPSCRARHFRCVRLLDHQVCEPCVDVGLNCTKERYSEAMTNLSSKQDSEHRFARPGNGDAVVLSSKKEPQRWNRICCPLCGTDFAYATAQDRRKHNAVCNGSWDDQPLKEDSAISSSTRVNTEVPEAYPIAYIGRAGDRCDLVNGGDTKDEAWLWDTDWTGFSVAQTSLKSVATTSRQRVNGQAPASHGRKSHVVESKSVTSVRRRDDSSEDEQPERQKPSQQSITDSRRQSTAAERDTEYCLTCKTWTSTCDCDQDLKVASASESRRFRAYSSGASSDGAHYESRARLPSTSTKSRRGTRLRDEDLTKSRPAGSTTKYRIISPDSSETEDHLAPGAHTTRARHTMRERKIRKPTYLDEPLARTPPQKQDTASSQMANQRVVRARKHRKISSSTSDSSGSWEINETESSPRPAALKSDKDAA